MRAFERQDVEARFDVFPEEHRNKLLQLREWILMEGDALVHTGGVEETLKWGEPSYLPKRPRIGSTVRLGRFDDRHVALYVNCQTLLVESMRAHYGDQLSFSKSRAVLFDVRKALPESAARHCVRMALYYHRDKRQG